MSLPQLTQEQEKVVLTWNQGLAVLAGAGAGKTTTLVLKCLELLRRDPEAKFAAVSFTERSASDLREKLSSKIENLRGHWVMTIHGLCGAIIREFPREAGFDGEETMLSEPESRALWERAIQTIWFDELASPYRDAMDRLLRRESRDNLVGLLRRVRELAAFGALEYLERADDPDSKALATLSALVLDRYDRSKRRAGALDFNDLENGADRALEHPVVRAAFRERFDLVLVDEFQDTNPVQARIIRKFCREDASNLCVVGDPKQSIYRFRDADVSLFEEFCAALPARAELTANFRSRPGILDFTNAICAPAFEESKLRYEPLIPSREPDPAMEPVIRLDIAEPADLGRWIQAERARGVPLSDMALLLRKIRGNEKWLKALTAAGIPLAVGSGGFFWEEARARELVAFLKWWDNPANALSGAIFLRAPWVAVSDAQIDQWISRDPTLMSSFLDSEHPLAKKLKPLRSKLIQPGALLMELLYDAKAEAELGAPLLGLWHRVEELSMQGMDFHTVVTEVARAVEEGRRERDVPPPKNQGQLSVLTLHSSKGLEFPHVILVDFGTKGRAPDAPLLFWDRAKGAFLGLRDEEGDRDKDNPVEAEWRRNEAEKALAESKRLFYVALTRARERLVLACLELPEPAPTKTKKEPAPPFSIDYWRAWVDAGPELPRAEIPKVAAAAPAAVNVFGATPARVERDWGFRRPRHSVTEWNLLSRCPRAYEWRYIRPKATGSEKPRTTSAPTRGGISGQDLGSRVHLCLELGDMEGLRTLETEAGSDRFRADPVIEWVKASPLMQEGESWRELAFELAVEGEILVGAIDRVVKTATGWEIIDFKITAQKKTPAEMMEAYRTQIELYSRALRALIGDPKASISAKIIAISPLGVQEIPVPIGKIALETLARDAAQIVAGKEAVPVPNSLCTVCDFRSVCPEAATASDF